MARYSESLTVRVSPALHRSLVAQAHAERRSVASLCRRLLAAAAPADLDQPCLAFAACEHPMTHRWRSTCTACGATVGAPGKSAAA